MTFKTELKDEEALAPLKEGIKNGKMGSLTVDPESLEVKKSYKGKCSYNSDAVILLLFIKIKQIQKAPYIYQLFPQSMVKTEDIAIRFPSRTITDKSNKDIVSRLYNRHKRKPDTETETFF